MNGHASVTPACIHMKIGGALLRRRDESGEPRMGRALFVHRAPRAVVLTGLRAGTPVFRAVYAEPFRAGNSDDSTLPPMRHDALQKRGVA